MAGNRSGMTTTVEQPGSPGSSAVAHHAAEVLQVGTRLGPAAHSGADVGREVLAGEGGAGGDEVGGCDLEDDPAAVVAGAGAEVDDPVGARHDRLVVRDDDDRLAV